MQAYIYLRHFEYICSQDNNRVLILVHYHIAVFPQLHFKRDRLRFNRESHNQQNIF